MTRTLYNYLHEDDTQEFDRDFVIAEMIDYEAPFPPGQDNFDEVEIVLCQDGLQNYFIQHGENLLGWATDGIGWFTLADGFDGDLPYVLAETFKLLINEIANDGEDFQIGEDLLAVMPPFRLKDEHYYLQSIQVGDKGHLAHGNWVLGMYGEEYAWAWCADVPWEQWPFVMFTFPEKEVDAADPAATLTGIKAPFPPGKEDFDAVEMFQIPGAGYRVECEGHTLTLEDEVYSWQPIKAVAIGEEDVEGHVEIPLDFQLVLLPEAMIEAGLLPEKFPFPPDKEDFTDITYELLGGPDHIGDTEAVSDEDRFMVVCGDHVLAQVGEEFVWALRKEGEAPAIQVDAAYLESLGTPAPPSAPPSIPPPSGVKRSPRVQRIWDSQKKQ